MSTSNRNQLLLCDNDCGEEFTDKCACNQSFCDACMDPEQHECSILSIAGQQASLDKEEAALQQGRESSQGPFQNPSNRSSQLSQGSGAIAVSHQGCGSSTASSQGSSASSPVVVDLVSTPGSDVAQSLFLSESVQKFMPCVARLTDKSLPVIPYTVFEGYRLKATHRNHRYRWQIDK
jgi:hypothetical protein